MTSSQNDVQNIKIEFIYYAYAVKISVIKKIKIIVIFWKCYKMKFSETMT